MERNKKFDVENVSKFFDNSGTEKYKRVYAEIVRKRNNSSDKKNFETK